MIITGNVIKYGDNVDTDVMIPARYLNTSDEKELAAHCMEDLDASFAGRVRPGDVMAAGWNFGCGSSREHAPIALKASGISLVIAKSFARIFYRNAINIGLPIIESPEAAEALREGDAVEADLGAGKIRIPSSGEEFSIPPFPEFIRGIIESGGLVNAVKNGVVK